MENSIYTAGQLGKVLRGRRKSLKLSQTAAAKIVGLLPKTISGLETTPERSSVESLFKLLSALELELVLRPKPFVKGKESRSKW
ncbi:MAG: helix-turn-helix domain-containing protein [Gammaproteobacteria bacterium]|nr:helix-turn-helix domain-containing protein [Gammaproteobacteria bacterium]